MPVPATINDLSTTAGSNYPAGTESPTTIDDYFRSHASFIAQLRDGKVATTGNETIAGVKTFSSTIVGNISGSAASATTATTATTATNCTNVAGGAAGSIPYQSGAGATSFVAGGTSGHLFQANGSGAPSWVNPATLSVSYASTSGSASTANNVTGTVAIANGGTGQTTASGAFSALKQDATTSATGVVELATDAEVQTGTDAVRAVSPSTMQANKLILGTRVNTTSGTSTDFTGIPSWAKRVTITFDGFSTNGTNSPIIQIGAGSIETTSYKNVTCSVAGAGYTASDYTTGFSLVPSGNQPTHVFHGSVTLTLQGSNTWCVSGSVAIPGVAICMISGAKVLGGTLDRVRMTTVGGTDTFDAGYINIAWE